MFDGGVSIIIGTLLSCCALSVWICVEKLTIKRLERELVLAGIEIEIKHETHIRHVESTARRLKEKGILIEILRDRYKEENPGDSMQGFQQWLDVMIASKNL